MDADQIDERTVPRVRPGLATVDVGGELVLHDPEREATRRLDATATVVWHCLDGRSSLGEIADDIVAVLGAERDAAVADLVRHVRRFARSGLLAGDGYPASRTYHPDSGGMPAGGTLAGSGTAASSAESTGGSLSPVRADPCAHSNRFGWVGDFAVAAGSHVLGVRCNDAELLDLLRRLFSPTLVDAPDPEPNFSLRRAVAGRAHRLQEGCRTLVHSGSLRRAMHALRAFLSAYADQSAGGSVRVGVVALVRDGAAVLVPERLRPRLGGADALLGDRKLAIADAIPGLSPDGTTVHIEPAGIPVDATVMAGVGRLSDGPEPPVAVAEPGSYRLAGWAWPARGDGSPPSPGELVAAADRTVRNGRAVGDEAALAALAAAVTGTRTVTLPVGPVPTHAVLDALDPLWLS